MQIHHVHPVLFRKLIPAWKFFSELSKSLDELQNTKTKLVNNQES